MPELPEVETVRRGLAPAMVGRRIERVEQRRPDLRFPLPERFPERLEGRTVEALDRRAKYLVGALSDGMRLVMHLGMSGSFRIAAPGAGPPTPTGDAVPAAGEAAASGDTPGAFLDERSKLAAHDHVVFHMAGGGTVTYNDPRRFGYMTLVSANEIAHHPLFRDLGIEPTGPDLTADRLAAAFLGKTTSLKAALLDQRIVAGLGNIYVCEALWRARLSPQRLAGSVPRRDGSAGERARRLVDGIRAVLADAIEAGGSSLRDYVHADGSLGYFQHAFAVYGREGEPCRRAGCGGTVARVVQTGRSTFFCPACQR